MHTTEQLLELHSEHQEWQSKNYTDETIKEVFIHFEENGGVFTAKIGNIRVVDIKCGKR